MGERTRCVATNRSLVYSVQLVESSHEGRAGELLSHLKGRSGLIVTTPTVAELYASSFQDQLKRNGIEFPLIVLDCHEETKDLAQVERICEAAFEHDLDRTSTLVALGGGVCTDIVSFAASMIRRGIGVLRVPTTLIGQVDAAIGVKGGINFKEKKSALGCFYPPEEVIVDPTFLRTLPDRHLRTGFAEIVKVAVAIDTELFEHVERAGVQLISTRFEAPPSEARWIIWRAIIGMIEELESNIYEDQTYKRRMDFGHTFSPLIEAKSGFRTQHGEAVAVDMALSAAIASRLGYLDSAARDRIFNLLTRLGLPVRSSWLSDTLLKDALIAAKSHRGGEVNLVLPTAIGSSVFIGEAEAMTPSILSGALEDLESWSHPRSTTLLTQPTTCLVFDIGGTKLRAALFSEHSGELSRIHSVPTPSQWATPECDWSEIYGRLIAAMIRLASTVLDGRAPSSVSIAFPGPIDGRGCVLAAPTIWGRMSARRIDLVARLKRHWPGAMIHVLNDVTAAGYRYLRSPQESFCVLTVSSGIGNKVFIKGEPIVGSHGRGGEIGHARVDFSASAPKCECGGLGHLGAISSGRGTLQFAGRVARRDGDGFARSRLSSAVESDPDAITCRAIVDAYHAGDPWTLDVVRQAEAPLSRVLAVLHSALGIERFTVIGGFALALGEQYRRDLAMMAEEADWHIGQQWNSLIELGFDDDLSGLIGAGRFAMGLVGSHPHPKSVRIENVLELPLHSDYLANQPR